MFLVDIFFSQTSSQLTLSSATTLINKIIDEWRYNGQIIGREIPIFPAQQEDEIGFGLRVICPEEHSLLAEWNNCFVQDAIDNARKNGLILDNFQIIGEDFNSEITCSNTPSWQILYTSYVQSCSPLHSGENFQPIPLYRPLKNTPTLAKDFIKWQENWQACDELQMNASALEAVALKEISCVDSGLFKHGYALCRELEEQTQIPTFYYLYRVGGESLTAEEQRLCPLCHKTWRLAEPLFGILHFKCDTCRLVSNLSWNF